MPRLKNAEIKWSYPRETDSALLSEICIESWGIYYISRKFGNNETLLYIGLAYHQNFIKRIKQHKKKWLNKYRGTKYIRFGEFVKPQNISKDLIEDAESCLIYELKPIHNKCKISSYSYSNEYKILSTGNRGVIPKVISMCDH
ncbi:GIY-YIG nuclease family protein [Flavobacterium sp. 3HN19-14]|uniref:GIY-YIG nuclease family protein n=1 Tax=Flavobacterium sp. 3HN19-14 TaxID=3448133 RepID=UPI003EE148BC